MATPCPLAAATASLIALLVLAAPATAGTDNCAGGLDAGNAFQHARLVIRPTTCTGSVDASGDGDDWYKVDIIAVQGPSDSLAVNLCAPVGSTVSFYVYFLAGGAAYTQTYPHVLAPSAGTFLASVTGIGLGGCGGMTLTVGPTHCACGPLTGPSDGGAWFVDVQYDAGIADYTLTLS